MPVLLTGRPDLEVVTINDFTPGVINGGIFNSAYSSAAPLGSASSAYRCHARPGIGLHPFPTYSTLFTKTFTGTYFTLASLKAQGASATANDILFSSWSKLNGTTFTFDIDISTGPGVNANHYTNNQVGTPSHLNDDWWPNLAKAWATTSSLLASCFTFDPSKSLSSPPSYVVMNGTGTTSTGTVSGSTANQFNAAFFTERFTALMTTNGHVTTTDVQALTNWVDGLISPENNQAYGAWGTFSTGETFIVFAGGGAVIISGDIQAPSSIIFLPGVTGAGAASGPGIFSPAGLLYVTDYDGVWLWNGGNTSQKISTQLRDDQFVRSYFGTAPNALVAGRTNVHGDTWTNWSFFPNNYVFDAVTSAWWQCEDPGVANFQVHASSSISTRYFYSSIANASAAANTALSIPVVIWDRTTLAQSYRWISNPIPVPGSDLVIGAVEICASNPTAQPATIVITPTAPPGQTPIPANQLPNQSVTFTIPPFTSSYRAAQNLGYNDYNACLQVDASCSAGAPILHELSCGYELETSFV